MTSIPGPFDFSKMAAGGFGQMLDGVEMVKRAWSNFNVPSAMLPTVDLNELDKRIADLKAVEQWLNVNQSMLHNAIQGLEIQRGTLAAIRAFSEQAGMPSQMAAMAKAASPAPKASPFSTDGWPMKPRPARTDPEAEAKPAQAAARTQPQERTQERTQEKPQAPDAADAPALTASAPGIDPGAWWTMLQNSFSQIAQAAAGASLVPGLAPGDKKATRSRAKTAAKGSTAGKKPASAGTGAGTRKRAAPARRRAS
jgi:hypothetical protein